MGAEEQDEGSNVPRILPFVPVCRGRRFDIFIICRTTGPFRSGRDHGAKIPSAVSIVRRDGYEPAIVKGGHHVEGKKNSMGS